MNERPPPEVAQVFAGYPARLRKPLLSLRGLIFDVAAGQDEVGAVVESLKWGQPSYATKNRAGSPIRLGPVGAVGEQFALYFHCQTTLVETFRAMFDGDLEFSGNRAVFFEPGRPLPIAELRVIIGLALTYHLTRGATTRARAQKRRRA
jgi:hypothetical protein